MTAFRQFRSVFGIIFKNNLKRTKGFGEKKSHKVASVIAIVFGAVVLLAYLVFFTVIITRTAITAGSHDKLLYLFVGLSQFAVLFFGSFVVLSYMYFSKDNQTLASLPLKTSAVFMAKFAMAYVSELIISALIIVPTVTTYGITCALNGITINATFFIIEVLGIFIFPVIPLLVISLLSLPLMYVVAFFRKRTISNAIAIALVIVVVMAIYFGLLGGFTSMMGNVNEDGIMASITPQMNNTFNKIATFTVFNKPIVDAMLGNKVAVNLVIYLVGIAVLLAINIVLSLVFYRKGMAIIIEGDGGISQKKAKKELVYTSSGLKFSLFKKELKTLANTPMTLVNSLMGVLLGPIVIFFMFKTGAFGLVGDSAKQDIYAIGFISYFTSLMVGATNQVAIVGISREGKNLFTLKSLPLSTDLLIKIKLYVATLINVVTVLVTALVFLILSPSHNVVGAIGIFTICVSCGFGGNCIGLHNDLKNPNLKWTNVSELSRNNKKIMKPVFIILGVGFSYMILGIIFSAIEPVKVFWAYAIFFACIFVINTLLIVVGYKKLFDNPQALMDMIEG